MLLRREQRRDAQRVRHVHAAAFAAPEGTEPIEVGLVDALRNSDAWIPELSIVALIESEIVGHVVCSRANIDPDLDVLGLAPIGVVPGHQGAGVGHALMHAVLGAADALDEPLVALVGDPDYYRRFGFLPGAALGLLAPEPSWGDAFQARTLTSYETMGSGRFEYAAPFQSL